MRWIWTKQRRPQKSVLKIWKSSNRTGNTGRAEENLIQFFPNASYSFLGQFCIILDTSDGLVDFIYVFVLYQLVFYRFKSRNPLNVSTNFLICLICFEKKI